MVLFLGLGYVAVRANFELPEGIGKGLSLHLMLAIGFKGGAELSENGMSGQIARSLIALPDVARKLYWDCLRLRGRRHPG